MERLIIAFHLCRLFYSIISILWFQNIYSAVQIPDDLDDHSHDDLLLYFCPPCKSLSPSTLTPCHTLQSHNMSPGSFKLGLNKIQNNWQEICKCKSRSENNQIKETNGNTTLVNSNTMFNIRRHTSLNYDSKYILCCVFLWRKITYHQLRNIKMKHLVFDILTFFFFFWGGVIVMCTAWSPVQKTVPVENRCAWPERKGVWHEAM